MKTANLSFRLEFIESTVVFVSSSHDLPEVTFPEKNLSKVCHRLVIQTLSMFSSFIYVQVKHGKKNQWMKVLVGEKYQ